LAVRDGLGNARCWFQATNEPGLDSLDAHLAEMSTVRPSKALREGITS
jgi:hypothetical protein